MDKEWGTLEGEIVSDAHFSQSSDAPPIFSIRRLVPTLIASVATAENFIF